MSEMEAKATGLALLRVPFPAHQISYIPKGGVKLAYVGHAALTDRLLDADPTWTWEPLSMLDGLPVFDGFGGMWIRLTVCGVTRLGYGHAGSKEGGDAIKEVIGDALRNAAMRFGAALDLWHKGDLHGDDKPEPAVDSKLDAVRSAIARGERIAQEAGEREFRQQYAGEYRGYGDNEPTVDSLVPVLEASIEQAKKTGARAAAAEESGARLDANTRASLIKLAKRIAMTFADHGAGTTLDLINDQGLSDDEQTYLNGQMDDSKLRSALKAEKQVRALKRDSPGAVNDDRPPF